MTTPGGIEVLNMHHHHSLSIGNNNNSNSLSSNSNSPISDDAECNNHHHHSDNTSTIEDTNNSSSSGNEEYFSIACVNCRKLHRKCNRKLPSCSECLDRGKECIYRTPKKKGRTKGSKNKPKAVNDNSSINGGEKRNAKNSRSEPYPTQLCKSSNHTTNNNMNHNLNPNIQMNEILISDLIKRRTVDLYFDLISVGRPVIKKTEIEKYLYSTTTESLDNSMKALLYSIQAITDQRLGQLDTSEISYKEAKRALGGLFDSLSNIKVRATYGLLALYTAGEGDDITTHFYLHALKSFTDNFLEDDVKMTEQQRAIQDLFCKATLCSKFNNLEDINTMWNGFKEFFMFKSEVTMPVEIEMVLRSGVNFDTLPILLKLADIMNRVMEVNNTHFALTQQQKNIVDILSDIITDATKILFYVVVGYDSKEICKLADKITERTTNEWFPYCPATVTHFVAVAAHVHCHYYERIELGLKSNEITKEEELHYFDVIAKDLRAMKLLNTRYKRIQKYYSNILKRLDYILQSRLNDQMKWLTEEVASSHLLQNHTINNNTINRNHNHQNGIYNSPILPNHNMNNQQQQSKVIEDGLFRSSFTTYVTSSISNAANWNQDNLPNNNTTTINNNITTNNNTNNNNNNFYNNNYHQPIESPFVLDDVNCGINSVTTPMTNISQHGITTPFITPLPFEENNESLLSNVKTPFDNFTFNIDDFSDFYNNLGVVAGDINNLAQASAFMDNSRLNK
ncbi:hypothetical protein ABK040_007951 [Willaertia magna]